MLTQRVVKPIIGSCEQCEAQDVDVFLLPGDITLCAKCKALEDAAYESSKPKLVQAQFASSSQAIQNVTDVHNAEVVPFTALHAAILADDTIPDEKKQLEFCLQIAAHRKHIEQVIFDAKRAYQFWTSQGQQEVGKLTTEQRELAIARLGDLDVNYHVTIGKTPKPTAEKAPKAVKERKERTARTESKVSTSTQTADISNAIEKYKLTNDRAMRARLLTRAQSKSITIDEAAKQLAEFYAG